MIRRDGAKQLDSAPGGRAHHHADPNQEDGFLGIDYVQQTNALIGRIDGQELLPHAIRLLSKGEPVALEALAAAG